RGHSQNGPNRRGLRGAVGRGAWAVGRRARGERGRGWWARCPARVGTSRPTAHGPRPTPHAPRPTPHAPRPTGQVGKEPMPQLPPSLAERVLPGVRETLAALAERDLALGLVTGNLRGIAEAKLSKAGVWGPFAAEGGGIGGYGDVSSERADLVRAALVMAEQALGRPVPAASAVIVGDTPHDIDCGRACAARTVGVATGRFTAAQLRDAGADFVLEDLTDQTPLLRFFLDGRATGG